MFIAGALANAGRVYLIQSSGHRIVANLRVSVMSAIMKKVGDIDDRPLGRVVVVIILLHSFALSLSLRFSISIAQMTLW